MKIQSFRSILGNTGKQLKEPLFNSASYLIALQLAISFFGFFFWAVAARFYSSDQVGIATAVFSMALLLGSIANLGLPTSLVYYFPRVENQDRLINACYSVPTVTATLMATVFIAGVHIWAPNLQVLQSFGIYPLLFILGTVVISLSKVQEVLFVAERVSKLSFYSGLLINVAKFPLLFMSFVLADWSVIFAAIVFASLLGLVVFNWHYQRTVRPDFKPAIVLSPKVWRPLAGYSLGNFIADRVSLLPDTIIPLIVLNMLGPSSSAHFFMAWSIAGTLSIAGRALGLALFVENSRDANVANRNVIRSLFFASAFLLPGILGIVLLGKPLLTFLGQEYWDQAGTLLVILAFSSIPLTLYRIASSVLKGQNKIKELVIVTVVASALNLLLTWSLAQTMALNGVGIARLLSTSITAIVIIWVAFPDVVRMQWLRVRAALAG
jgi:O-antigen/teichoic acid export membrane protein